MLDIKVIDDRYHCNGQLIKIYEALDKYNLITSELSSNNFNEYTTIVGIGYDMTHPKLYGHIDYDSDKDKYPIKVFLDTPENFDKYKNAAIKILLPLKESKIEDVIKMIDRLHQDEDYYNDLLELEGDFDVTSDIEGDDYPYINYCIFK